MCFSTIEDRRNSRLFLDHVPCWISITLYQWFPNFQFTMPLLYQDFSVVTKNSNLDLPNDRVNNCYRFSENIGLFGAQLLVHRGAQIGNHCLILRAHVEYV